MNLADLVKRKDRSIEVKTGEVEALICSHSGYKMHAIKFEPETVLYVNGADEFNILKTFPRQPNWKVLYEGKAVKRALDSLHILNHKKDAVLLVEIESNCSQVKREKLFEVRLSATEAVRKVLLNWPVWAGQDSGYNLRISNRGDKELYICSGYAFNPRQKITPMLKGKGVEVGPGMNPHILPAKDVDIRYVESMPSEEWLKLYKKQDKPPKAITENLWSKYIVGDARELATIEDDSLDFIFSNHVFEHLMNPMQVLENWSSKLKQGGIIVGVIPDCRYTFDLRQPPSTKEEWEQEYDGTVNEIGRDKYERWCRYTAPYNTPESLVERNYSIHVHYYTPVSFSKLINPLIEKGIFQTAFYNTSPNNKDFGFVLRKVSITE